VIALGVVLAAVEDATGVHSWRNIDPATARYLGLLAELGYVLSDVEKLAAGIKPKSAKRAQAPAGTPHATGTEHAAA
jgi:ParB family chromosome partitioning protein